VDPAFVDEVEVRVDNHVASPPCLRAIAYYQNNTPKTRESVRRNKGV
jgi:hypothetical protein